jgi:DNA-binding beta-propeller fold protein YncE
VVAQQPSERPSEQAVLPGTADVVWTSRPFDGVDGFLTEGPFHQPAGLAFDPGTGELLLLDTNQDRIGIFSRSLHQKFSFGGSEALPASRKVEVGPDGTIYALFQRTDVIRVFNYRGEWQRDIVVEPIAERVRLSSLDWGPDGLLLVGESVSGRLLALDPATGRKVWDLGTKGYGAGRFGGIAGAAMSPDGSRIYVIDPTLPTETDERDKAHVVQVFDARTRRHLFGWGSHGLDRLDFSLPDSIAVAPSGLVLVSDNLRHVVKVFDSDGAYVMMIGGIGRTLGALYYPAGIVVDQHHVLYVAEKTNRRITAFQLFREDRRRVPIFQPSGKAPSLLGKPFDTVGYSAWRELDPDAPAER